MTAARHRPPVSLISGLAGISLILPLSWASLWQIGPTATALEHVDDARDHPTIIHAPCAGLMEFGP
jgi:hypothetical protein